MFMGPLNHTELNAFFLISLKIEKYFFEIYVLSATFCYVKTWIVWKGAQDWI